MIRTWDAGHERWIAEVVDPYGDDDVVPALNGVKVGQTYVNIHTGTLARVESIRLGGHDTYRGHEATVQLEDVAEERVYGMSPSPLWSLAEHWDLVAEPGEEPERVHRSGDQVLEDGQLTLDAVLDWRRLEHPVPYRPDPRFGPAGRTGLHRDNDVCVSVRRERRQLAERERGVKQLELDDACVA